MSENRNRGNQGYSMYDTMSTEELEEILRLDLETPAGEESDIEMILYVMEVLEKRHANEVRPGKTAQEAYEEFREYYLPGIEEEDHSTDRKHGMPCLVRKLIAAAAVLAVVLLGTLTADAFGANIWGTIARWTKDTFHFESIQPSEAPVPNENHVTYSSLQEALAKHGIDEALVPTWIPDGYVLADIKIEETPVKDVYAAHYIDGKNELSIIVRSNLHEAPAQIEITDEPVEVYVSNGIIYYIFSNNDCSQIAWVLGSYECNIWGDITVEQLKMMIDSLEKG